MSLPEGPSIPLWMIENNQRVDRKMREEDDLSAQNIMPYVKEAIETALRQACSGLGMIGQVLLARGAAVNAATGLSMNIIAIRIPGDRPFGVDYRISRRIVREILRDTAIESPYCNVLADERGLVEQSLAKRGFPINVVNIHADLRHDAGESGVEGYTTILIFKSQDTATLFAGGESD